MSVAGRQGRAARRGAPRRTVAPQRRARRPGAAHARDRHAHHAGRRSGHRPGAAAAGTSDIELPESIEDDLVLLGFVGMIDPPRAEAKDAVAIAKRAHIRTVMITGDHPATAEAIARELDDLRAGRAARHRHRAAHHGRRRARRHRRARARVRPRRSRAQAAHRRGAAAQGPHRRHDRRRHQRRARRSRPPISASPWASPAPTSPRKPPTWC